MCVSLNWHGVGKILLFYFYYLQYCYLVKSSSRKSHCVNICKHQPCWCVLYVSLLCLNCCSSDSLIHLYCIKYFCIFYQIKTIKSPESRPKNCPKFQPCFLLIGEVARSYLVIPDQVELQRQNPCSDPYIYIFLPAYELKSANELRDSKESVCVWEGAIGNRCSVSRNLACTGRKDRRPAGSWWLEWSNRRNADVVLKPKCTIVKV